MKIEAEVYDDAVYFSRRFEVFASLGSPMPLKYDGILSQILQNEDLLVRSGLGNL